MIDVAAVFAEKVAKKAQAPPSPVLRLELLEVRNLMAAFTPGDVVVYRVGDSTTPAGNSAATTVYLDEYNPTTGNLVQSIELSNSSASGIALTDSGKAGSAGQLSLGPNGQDIALFGYNANVGTASVTSSTVQRTVGIVGANGVVQYEDFSNTAVEAANNARTAVYDPTTGNLYLGGKLGINYTGSFANGTANASATLIGNASASTLEIFNGQLYYAVGGGISAYGTGEPTANATATALSFANGAPSAVEGFFLARLGNGPASGGYDTLYLIDQGGNNTSGGSIDKFSYNGTNWVSDGTITGVDGANATLNGITGLVNGNGTVSLYASAGSISNANQASQGADLYTLVDSTGANGTMSGNLATPGSGVTVSNPVHLGNTSDEAFRGIVLVPSDTVGNFSIGTQTSANFTLGNSPITPANGATFTDSSNDLMSGNLVISDLASGNASIANDAISIANGGGITASGGVVSYDGQQIGTYSGGSSGGNLTIAFNSLGNTTNVVTSPAVQALLNEIDFSASGNSAEGNRTLTYAVNEPRQANIAEGNITVDVLPAAAGNLPTINQSANVAVNESSSPGLQTANLSGITANGAGQTLSVTATSSNQSLVANGSITVNYSNPNSTGNITFTPAANVAGNATITVTVTDTNGSTNDTFDFTAVAPPTISPPANQSASENSNHTITFGGSTVADSYFTTGNITLNLVALDGNLTVQSVANGAAISNNDTANVTLTGTPTAIDTTLAAGAVYHGNANFTGNDTLTLLANDLGNTASNSAQQSSANVTIAVSGPSVSTDVGFATPIGITTTLANTNLKATDPDYSPSQLTYNLISLPAGTLFDKTTSANLAIGSTFTQADINAGNITYTSVAGGNDSFSFSVSDPANNTTANTTLAILVDTPTTANYSTPNADYTQNFDGLPSTSGNGPTFTQDGPFDFVGNSSAAPPQGISSNSSLDGWSMAQYGNTGANAAEKFVTDFGNAQTTGAVYSFGGNGAANRALGLVGTGTDASEIGVTLVNTTGETINQISISYLGEQWTSNTNPNTLSFGYALGASSIVGANFTTDSNLNYVGSITSANAAENANGTPLASANEADTIGNLAWASGETLVLRWQIAGTGSAAGLAIDNFSFSGDSAPVLATDTGISVGVGQSATIGNSALKANDTDNTDAQLTYTLTSVPTDGTLELSGSPLAANGTFTQAQIDNGNLSFLAGNSAGNSSFAFTVSDPEGATTSGNFTTTALSANTPTINQSSNVAIAESAGLQTINLSGITANGTGLTLTVTASSDNQSLIANGSISVGSTPSGNGTDTLTFTPTANASGTANITVTVSDSDGNATDKFEVTAVAPPTITSPGNQSATKDANHTITFGSNAVTDSFFTSGNMSLDLVDVDGNLTVQTVANGAAISNNDSANVTLTGTPTAISLTLAAGVTYNSGNFAGNDTLTLTADDLGNTALGTPLTSNQTLGITVATPPTINQSSNVAVAESAGLQTINLSGITANGTGLTLTVTASSDNQSLIANGSISVGSTPNANGTDTLTFTPTANASGTANITVTVSDSDGNATDKFEVTAVAPPTITSPGNQSATKDANHTITFGSNAVTDSFFTSGNMSLDLVDVDGNLTVQTVANGAAISNNDSANVTLTGTPTAISLTLAAGVTYNSGNFAGNDTLTLTADDLGNTALGTPQTSNQTVNIAVTALPTINQSSNVAVAESAGLQTINLSGITNNGTGLTLTVTASSDNQSLVANGSISVGSTPSGNGTDTLTFTPTANASGTANITVTVSDSDGNATDKFEVTAVAPPTIISPGDQSATTNTNDTIPFGSNSVSDSFFTSGNMSLDLVDVDGNLTVQTVANGAAISNNDSANVTLTGTPTAISLTLAAGVTYNSGNFAGNDTLTLTADDLGNTALGTPQTSNQSVNIDVTAPPTINQSSNVAIAESANPGLQTVDLSGITDNGTGDTLTVTASSDNQSLIANGSISVNSTPNGDGTDTLTFTPTANASGTANITVTVSDSDGSANDTFEVTVVAPPTITSPGNQSAPENASFTIPFGSDTVSDSFFTAGNISLNLTDVDGTLTIATGVPGGVDDSGISDNDTGNVTLTGTPSAISATLAAGVTYNGGANFTGNDTLTLTADDLGNTALGTPLTSNETLNIAVSAAAPPAPTSAALDPGSNTGGFSGFNYTSDDTPQIDITAAAGETVTLQLNGNTVATAVAGSGNQYTANLPAGTLAVGTNSITAIASNANGTSPASAPLSVTYAPSYEQVYTVPGVPGTAETLDLNWISRSAAYNDEIGWYTVTSLAGTVNGIAPGTSGYAQAAITSTSQVVFASGDQGGESDTISVTGGQLIAFYMIQNDSTADFLSTNPADSISAGPLAFFTTTAANPDSFQHVQVVANPTTGQVQLSWEDMTHGGDKDFNDVVMTIALSGGYTGAPGSLQIPGGGSGNTVTVSATLDGGTSLSSVPGDIGFFYVDDASGDIGSLSPGSPGYAAAALASGNFQVLFTQGQGAGAVASQDVPAGKLIAFYTISNGTTAQFLAANPTNSSSGGPVAFFSFTAANPDSTDHFRFFSPEGVASTGPLELHLMDQLFGTDQDYDSLAMNLNIGN